jgi:hypothetical protein
MVMARDLLSVRYDGATAALVADAITNRGRWVYRAVPRPESRSGASRRWLAQHGIELDQLDSGGLTRYQRAYQRSLFDQARDAGIGKGAGPDYTLSMQRTWGPETAYGRLLGVRITTRAAAVRATRRKPAAERYTQNRALASAGRGGPEQRFP